jgi:TM2 domain-containing membrane protein YozV
LATLFGGRVPTAEFGMIAKEIVCWVLSVFGLENTLEGKVAKFKFYADIYLSFSFLFIIWYEAIFRLR